MTTASAHPIGKKRAIMDAARRLLVSHGYQDVTMDDVAHQAGVGKGTLFLYYKNKEQLLSAALADLSDQLRESLDGLAGSGKTGKALLEEAIAVVLRHFERNSDFVSQISLGRIPGCGHRCSSSLQRRFSENHRRVVRVLTECVASGLLRGEDLELSASFLFALCRSAALHKLFTGRDLGPAARRQKVLEFFLKGAGR